MFTRRFAEALPKLLLAVQDDPNFPMPWRYLAICHAQMGRLDEARNVVTRLRAITPLVVANDHIFHRPEDRKFYLSGLRLAAGEAS